MSQAVTGSLALEQLKDDLTLLANNLRELHSTLTSQMTTLGESWQDSQYQQFVDGYKPQIEKCVEIANRYDHGCRNFLAPQIENVKSIEQTDLSGNFGGGASMSGTDTGAMSSRNSDIASGFNLGTSPSHSSAPRTSTPSGGGLGFNM